MHRYGPLHSIGDFIAKAIPKRQGAADVRQIHSIITGLKRLDNIQQNNQLLTYTVSAGGGIWITHAGRRLFMIIPGQKTFRIITGKPGDGIATYFDSEVRSGVIADTTGDNDYRQWTIPIDQLDRIWTFIESLPSQTEGTVEQKRRHARNFPGIVRQAALQLFEQNQRMCPGVSVPGKEQKPHKLRDADRVEFDHILPYALGGSRSVLNIQVLCETCNRLKRATAH